MNVSTTPCTSHPALAPGMRGDYQRPDTTATLREGLAEYYRVNPGLVDPAVITDPRSAAYFHSHDCTHVIFGTHTGPVDEGINDLYTMLGVDIRLRDYVTGFFASDEGKAITKSLLRPSLLSLVWQTLMRIPEAWRLTRKMHEKWPWSVPEAFMDRPLVELRREFGIELGERTVESSAVVEVEGRASGDLHPHPAPHPAPHHAEIARVRASAEDLRS